MTTDRISLLRKALEFDEKAVTAEWMRIWEKEGLRDEDFITPGYAAYDDGILKLVCWHHARTAKLDEALVKFVETMVDYTCPYCAGTRGHTYAQCLEYKSCKALRELDEALKAIE